MQSPILGASYVARSVNAACNRMINLFPEAIPDGGKMPAFLQKTPGLRPLIDVGDGPIRGMWYEGTPFSPLYVVSGDGFYIVTDVNAAPVQIPGVVGDSGRVSIADNGFQIFIATNPGGYIYDRVTDTLTQITDPDFPGAVTVGYLDGYFLFNEPQSQKFWWTSILDGTQIDALDFASAEGAPDDLVGLIVANQEIIMFGTNSIEFWYNAGTLDIPFARNTGATLEIGCAARYSIAKLDNTIFWLGRDDRGSGVVYRLEGYKPTRVSTHAVEWQIQQYADMTDASAYTYQQDGHSYYVLNFPTAQTTWVYDVATQVWHERASFVAGEFIRHRGECQANFFHRVVIGDFETSNIYQLDPEYHKDGAFGVQRWLRSWRALPTGTNKLKRQSHHSLQLDCESGVGVSSPDEQGYDPEVMLRWSDDGGHTWSREHWAKMGKIGEKFKRVLWRRLGMTEKLRDRVYEVSGSDPVKIAITGAELIGVEEDH